MKRLAATLGVLVLLLLGSIADAQDVGTVLGGLAARLDEAGNLRDKAIGVQAFSASSGSTNALGAFLADQLDAVLTERGRALGFKVVTRAQLCQVIQENKLGLDDQFAQRKKLGNLTQADYLVTGLVTPLGNQASLSVRMLDTETGQQVWARVATVRLDEGLKALLGQPVRADGCGNEAAKPAPPAPNALQIKVWTDKKNYRLGDTVKIGLRVNRDAYVTLVNIGTSGDVTILYPNRFHPTHFVRGGQDVIIPPPDSGFTLAVQPPVGFDQIRAIATEEPVAFQAGDFRGAQAPTFRSLDRVQTRNFSVVIKNERDKVAPGKWAEEVIAVEVAR